MRTRILAVSAVVVLLAGGIAVLAKQEAPEPSPTPPPVGSAEVRAQAELSPVEHPPAQPAEVGAQAELPPVEPPPAQPAEEAASELPSQAPTKWRASPTEKSPAAGSPTKDEADATVASPARSPRLTSGDPLQAVDSFVDRNRRETGEAIRQLNAEAKDLRERLKKVESALARWQKISRALDQDSDAEVTETPPRKPKFEAAEPAPSELAPVPPNTGIISQ